MSDSNTALPSARAGQATPQAPTGLGHSVTIANAELVEQIEAADKGSRKLDAVIYQMLHPHMVPVPGKLGHFYDPSKTGPRAAAQYHISGGATGMAMSYTTSIDSATVLIPIYWNWSLQMSAWESYVDQRSGPPQCIAHLVYRGRKHKSVRAEAATPALALSAAALRAMSS